MCRRSLRIWPVPGDNPCEWLKEFLKHRLKLSPVFLGEMGQVHVKRVTGNVESQIKDEVISVLPQWKSGTLSVKLPRSWRELQMGRFMHEIPFCLQTSLKALESVSYNLKQRNPSIKRSIRFDDQAMDLV